MRLTLLVKLKLKRIKLSLFKPLRRMGNRSIAPLFRNFNFTLRSVYVWGQRLRFLLSIRQFGPKNRCEKFEEVINIFDLPGFEPRFFSCRLYQQTYGDYLPMCCADMYLLLLITHIQYFVSSLTPRHDFQLTCTLHVSYLLD